MKKGSAPKLPLPGSQSLHEEEAPAEFAIESREPSSRIRRKAASSRHDQHRGEGGQQIESRSPETGMRAQLRRVPHDSRFAAEPDSSVSAKEIAFPLFSAGGSRFRRRDSSDWWVTTMLRGGEF